MPRTTAAMVACSTSPPPAGRRLKRRPPTEINFAAVSPQAGSLSSDGDDATSVGFSTSTEAALAQCATELFAAQNPSAPPLSRGTSTVSWTTRHRRKRSDSTSSNDVAGNRAPFHQQQHQHQHQHQQHQQRPHQHQQNRITKPLPPSKHGRPQGIPNDISFNHPLARQQQPAGQATDGSTRRTGCVIKLHRPIMSRHCRDTLRVRETVEPVDKEMDGAGGCCGLCRAPSQLPCCASVLPCCAYPEELEQARRESSYLVIRDNSVEFNNAMVVMGSRPAAARVASANNAHGKGQYRGACGCTHHVRDDARVLYFDDPLLGDVSAMTGGWTCWAGLRRLFCGGRGQAVRVQSRLCCGLCVRARGLVGLPCVPACCVCLCPSSALRYNMPAKDAVTAAAKIRQARDNALMKMREEGDAHAAVPYERS